MSIKEKFWFYFNSAKLFRENKSPNIEVKRTLTLAKMYREMLLKENH